MRCGGRAPAGCGLAGGIPALGITRPAGCPSQGSSATARPVQVPAGGFDVVRSLFELAQPPAENQKSSLMAFSYTDTSNKLITFVK